MSSLNLVQLIGNLGRDAELRYTPGGTAVATVNLATTQTWTDKAGARQSKTEWHRVVLWGKTAEALAEYLTKGKQIYVAGTLETKEWTDRNQNKRTSTEIRADKVVLLGGGGGRRETNRDAHLPDEAVNTGADPGTQQLTDDDIPF